MIAPSEFAAPLPENWHFPRAPRALFRFALDRTQVGRFSVVAVGLLLLFTSSATAQVTYNFNNPAGGVWSSASNWTPAGGPPNSTSSIARLDLNPAYTLDVDGSFTVAALQFGPNQTGAVNVRDPGGASTRQLVLVPGTGANGSNPANNGLTTLFVEGGASTTNTIRPIVFLGGGSAGSPVNHVWEIQGTRTVNVTGQIQATSASGNTITKEGTGTLTLSANNFGTNGWFGGLTVNGGTVLANGPQNATGLGPVTVNNSGTLGGRGRISLGAGAPPVTVNAGGTLSAGISAAAPELTIESSVNRFTLSMNVNSVLGVKLFGNNAGEISKVTIPSGGGKAEINTNRLNLDLTGIDADQFRSAVGIGNSRTYRVLTVGDSEEDGGGLFTNGLIFNQAGLTITNLGSFSASEWTVDVNTMGDPLHPGGFVSVTFATPVPEPHTVLAVPAAVGAIVSWRRKKRSLKATA